MLPLAVGYTVMVRVKVAPEQVPLYGVTVYVAVPGLVVLHVRVPVMLLTAVVC